MAGRRLAGPRSGELSEDLGIVLLKQFAAVAAVQRTEDFGLDATATLLREGDDDLLYAEDSFFVQIKGAGVRVIKYKGHEVKWLRSLKLPLLIASVSNAKASIELYGTNRIAQVLIEADYPEIQVHLDSIVGEVKEDARFVHLGSPILSWNLTALGDKGFPRLAYEILKPHIECEQDNIQHRHMRYFRSMTWNTNEVPRLGYVQLCQSDTTNADLVEALKRLGPPLMAIGSRITSAKDRAALDFALHIVNYMRSHGLNPDPQNIYQMLADNWEKVSGPGPWSIKS